MVCFKHLCQEEARCTEEVYAWWRIFEDTEITSHQSQTQVGAPELPHVRNMKIQLAD